MLLHPPPSVVVILPWDLPRDWASGARGASFGPVFTAVAPWCHGDADAARRVCTFSQVRAATVAAGGSRRGSLGQLIVRCTKSGANIAAALGVKSLM